MSKKVGLNYREFDDGVVICDLFNIVCTGNKDCDTCETLIEYCAYSDSLQELEGLEKMSSEDWERYYNMEIGTVGLYEERDDIKREEMGMKGFVKAYVGLWVGGSEEF